jgi:hypothetical protein
VKRTWSYWVSIAWVGGFAIFIVYDLLVNAPRAAHIETALGEEWSLLRHPSSSEMYGLHSSYKTRQALVGAKFRSRWSYPEIRDYYDAEFRAHGWTVAGEKPIRDWGKDLGGVSRGYLKGDYCGTVQFAGDRANYGWNYAVSLSWGLGMCP